MFSEQNELEINKNLDFSVESGCHQIKLLDILRNNLPKFSTDFKDSIPENKNTDFENYISQELCFFFNNNVLETGYLFLFQAFGPDIQVRQFGSTIHSSALFLIEAKRLPCTSSTNDYVSTGIGRFRNEKHGKQYSIAAMLGYVQENNFDHWFGEVNSWIVKLISDQTENPRWTTNEQISKIQAVKIGEYISKHPRITKNQITLYHFWLNFCNSN
jgi:hypothetical protein